MTTVYFLRHGQSLGNKNNLFLGHTDMDLSALGFRQAKLASKFFDTLDIDVIYSSDLCRAYNTVKPTADKKGLIIHTSEKLREIYAGEWEGRTIDDLWDNYTDSFSVWKNDIGNSICDNGESVSALQNRINAEVNRIVEENKGKKILIATHATPIRVLSCIWNGVPVGNAKNFSWVTNASVTCVEYNDDGTYFVCANSFDKYLGDNTSKLSKKI